MPPVLEFPRDESRDLDIPTPPIPLIRLRQGSGGHVLSSAQARIEGPPALRPKILPFPRDESRDLDIPTPPIPLIRLRQGSGGHVLSSAQGARIEEPPAATPLTLSGTRRNFGRQPGRSLVGSRLRRKTARLRRRMASCSAACAGAFLILAVLALCAGLWLLHLLVPAARLGGGRGA